MCVSKQLTSHQPNIQPINQLTKLHNLCKITKLAKETNQSLNSNLNVLLLFVVFLLNGHEVSGDVCDNEEDECDNAEEQPHVDGL